MAAEVKIAVVRGTAPSSNVNKSFTTANLGGLTPKAALVFTSNIHTAATSPSTNPNFSIGFFGGGNQVAVGVNVIDSASSQAYRRMSETTCIQVLDSSGNIRRTAAPAAWVSDGGDGQTGATLQFAGSDTSEPEITIVFFAGSGVTVCGCGGFDTNNTLNGTANFSVSAEPDLMFFICAGGTSANLDAATQHAIQSFGVAHYDGSTITQLGALFASRDSQADEKANSLISSNRVVGQVFDDTISWLGEVTAVSASAITVTTRTGASGGDRPGVLALSFGDRASKVMALDSPTNADADWSVSGVGFTPQIVGLLTTHLSTMDNLGIGLTSTAHGVAVADKHGAESSHHIAFEDGAATMNTTRRGSASLMDFSDPAGAQAFLSTSGGLAFNSDGFTLPNANLMTADSTARKWILWAVEDEAGGGGGATILRHMMQYL